MARFESHQELHCTPPTACSKPKTVMKVSVNWYRGTYLGLFFCNAIFATVFKAVGEEALDKFGTFADCDIGQNASCRGNQMVFRASVSIAAFFILQTLQSRFGPPIQTSRCLSHVMSLELLVYVALIVGSFFMPSAFFDGYVQFSRVMSGFFILFQIVSIIGASYQARDYFLDRIADAEQNLQSTTKSAARCCTAAICWKAVFLGSCLSMLIATAAGVASLYNFFGGCGIGVAFTTITVVAAALLLGICVSTWMDVGLLPPCVVSAYLVLMCWQALTSAPDDSCADGGPSLGPENPTNVRSVIANAIIASFAITWTSWRSSAEASTMFSRDASTKKRKTNPPRRTYSKDFAGVVVVDIAEAQAADESDPSSSSAPNMREPWQFHCMMVLAGIYMAMVLTDWNSAAGASNGTSMWVKIVAQWLTILLFAWTLAAPKLFPDRDFST